MAGPKNLTAQNSTAKNMIVKDLGAKNRQGPGPRLASLPGQSFLRPDETSSPLGPRFSPLYQQVRDWLIARLRHGEWAPGQALPSEAELARQLGLSQGTVRKAIDSLAADNLVTRRQGRGTFVATHAEAVAQFRFLRIRPDRGEALQPESRILSLNRLRAGPAIAERLAIRQQESCVQIRRLLIFDSKPVVLDEIWLPGQRFRGLTLDRLRDYSGPLYGLFESEFKTRMIRCEERIRAIAASPMESLDLMCQVGAPLLSVERVSYGYDNSPVELRIGYCLTQGFHYINYLT